MRCLIIGDSQTKYFKKYLSVYSHCQVTVNTVSGRKVQGVGNIVVAACQQFEYIVIHLGTNNIPDEEPAKTVKRMKSLLESIRERNPGCILYVSSVLPRATSSFNGPVHSQEDIDKLDQRAATLNFLYKGLLERFSNCYFVDNNVNFMCDGAVQRHLLSRDGLHLAPSGIKTLLDNIISSLVLSQAPESFLPPSFSSSGLSPLSHATFKLPSASSYKHYFPLSKTSSPQAPFLPLNSSPHSPKPSSSPSKSPIPSSKPFSSSSKLVISFSEPSSFPSRFLSPSSKSCSFCWKSSSPSSKPFSPPWKSSFPSLKPSYPPSLSALSSSKPSYYPTNSSPPSAKPSSFPLKSPVPSSNPLSSSSKSTVSFPPPSPFPSRLLSPSSKHSSSPCKSSSSTLRHFSLSSKSSSLLHNPSSNASIFPSIKADSLSNLSSLTLEPFSVSDCFHITLTDKCKLFQNNLDVPNCRLNGGGRPTIVYPRCCEFCNRVYKSKQSFHNHKKLHIFGRWDDISGITNSSEEERSEISNPRGSEGISNPWGSEGIPNPSGPVGISNSINSEGISKPFGSEGITELSRSEGISNISGSEGISNISGSEGISNPRDTEQISNPRGSEGISKPSCSGGNTKPGSERIYKPSGSEGYKFSGISNPRGSEGILNPRDSEGISSSNVSKEISSPCSSEGISNPSGSEGIYNLRGSEGSLTSNENICCILKKLCEHKNECLKRKTNYPRTCNACSHVYKNKSTFFSHKKRCSKFQMDSFEQAHYPRKCSACSLTFPCWASYNKHNKFCCKSQGNISCTATGCGRSFPSKRIMMNHLKAHHLSKATILLLFNTEAQFYAWKRREECEKLCYYKKVRGSVKSGGKTRLYFKCMFNVKESKYEPKTARRRKSGRIPVGSCPSQMIVHLLTIRHNGVLVKYTTCHSHPLKDTNSYKYIRQVRSLKSLRKPNCVIIENDHSPIITDDNSSDVIGVLPTEYIDVNTEVNETDGNKKGLKEFHSLIHNMYANYPFLQPYILAAHESLLEFCEAEVQSKFSSSTHSMPCSYAPNNKAPKEPKVYKTLTSKSGPHSPNLKNSGKAQLTYLSNDFLSFHQEPLPCLEGNSMENDTNLHPKSNDVASTEKPFAVSLPPMVAASPVRGESFTSCLTEDEARQFVAFEGVLGLRLYELKSLDPYITCEEVCMLKGISQQFTKGWLYDSIIDIFISIMCRGRSDVFAFYSFPLQFITSLCLSVDEKIERLHGNQDLGNLRNATTIFIPINPTGAHWILIVVHPKSKIIHVFDPATSSIKHHHDTILQLKDILSKILEEDLSTWPAATSPRHVLQSDSINCGVFVCFYVLQIICGESLNIKFNPDDFRKSLYKTITSNLPRMPE